MILFLFAQRATDLDMLLFHFQFDVISCLKKYPFGCDCISANNQFSIFPLNIWLFFTCPTGNSFTCQTGNWFEYGVNCFIFNLTSLPVWKSTILAVIAYRLTTNFRYFPSHMPLFQYVFNSGFTKSLRDFVKADNPKVTRHTRQIWWNLLRSGEIFQLFLNKHFLISTKVQIFLVSCKNFRDVCKRCFKRHFETPKSCICEIFITITKKKLCENLQFSYFTLKSPKLHAILKNIWFRWLSDIIGLVGQTCAIYPDSMDALAQRWFMVGRLADGWRWFCNVGPT